MATEDYQKTLDQAMVRGREKHPEAPTQHHAAFANSVAYLVSGMSGGFGGPSMREHLASRIAMQGNGSGNYSFETACAAVEVCCFGPITKEHANMLACGENCFNDADGEIEEAKQLLNSD